MDQDSALCDAIIRNVQFTQALVKAGKGPQLIGTVCGTKSGQAFWQHLLQDTKQSFGAEIALSLQEDLPVGQAFGLLYLWHQLKPHTNRDMNPLIAFVFGSGTRSTPFTEHDCGQKPAIASFVMDSSPGMKPRFLSMVELAMEYFIGVQHHLHQSGFRGLIVKWGDEVQVPITDLAQQNPLFQNADIVRFVSLQTMTEDTASNKDWVGVNEHGHITQFIPRRSLQEMEPLAAQGLITRNADGDLLGGINLGSIAVSFELLDVLLDEFHDEVFDTSASYSDRPALDPEFFTALSIAADSKNRKEVWDQVLAESSAMQKLVNHVPKLYDRLIRVMDTLEQRKGQPAKFVAMDFKGQYWGDIGQHHTIFDFYTGLNAEGTNGAIARAIAGISDIERDVHGNILVNSTLGPGVEVKNSVLINATIQSGKISQCVLLGTQAQHLDAQNSFDVLSVVADLTLQERAGSYRVVSKAPLALSAGERATTIYREAEPLLYRVMEETDLRDKEQTYNRTILENPSSFKDIHAYMAALEHSELVAWREKAEQEVLGIL